MHERRYFLRALAVAGAMVLTLAVGVRAGVAADDELASTTWEDLKYDLFGDAPLLDDGLIVIDAPERAEDAAVTPVTVKARRSQAEGPRIERLTLVIDENPAPVAAVFSFGDAIDRASVATRVRVNAYSWIHAVAETSDGALHVARAFVKASGGCSAPAGKDAEAARAHMGEMRLKQRLSINGDGPQSRIQKTTLMVRHPNYSGLQKDQMTQYYIPALYVRSLEFRQGDALVLGIEGAISISEDPNFTFSYAANGEPVTARVTDTDENIYTRTWSADGKPGA